MTELQQVAAYLLGMRPHARPLGRVEVQCEPREGVGGEHARPACAAL